MQAEKVGHALCVSVTLDKFPEVLALAEQFDNFYASVGVHPDYEDIEEPSVETLVTLANHPKIVAIGETGLDYFRLTGDLEWQRTRFRTHIRAAILAKKPLIIHTRSAAADTLRIMQEEGAAQVGGVMHCFTENQKWLWQPFPWVFTFHFLALSPLKTPCRLKKSRKKFH